MGTNVDGRVKIMYAITKIRGIGRRMASLILKKAEIDQNKRAGEVSAEEMERIMQIVVPQPQPRLQDGQDPAAVLLHAGQQAPRGPGAHEEDPAAPRSAPLLGPQGPWAAHLLHRPERWPPQPHHRAQVGGGAGDGSQGGTLLLLIERVRPGDGGGGAGR